MSIVGVNHLQHLSKLPLEAKELLFAYFDKLDQHRHLLDIVEGVYIVGSVALGDFHADKSDVNFVVVLNSMPDRVAQTRYRVIHKMMAKRFKRAFNGYYIPAELLASKDKELLVDIVKDGKYKKRQSFEMSDVVLYELQQSGICVYGTPIEKLEVDVQIEDVITALHNHINTHWTKWLRKHRLVLPKGWSLLRHPTYTEQGVLGVARQLYTLRSGAIGSKHLAGIYLSRYMKGEYADVIKQATNTRQDAKKTSKWSFLRYTQTRAIVQKTIDAFNKDYERFQLGAEQQAAGVA